MLLFDIYFPLMLCEICNICDVVRVQSMDVLKYVIGAGLVDEYDWCVVVWKDMIGLAFCRRIQLVRVVLTNKIGPGLR